MARADKRRNGETAKTMLEGIHAVIFDLDGTLCFDGMTMSKELQEVLLTAPKYGHEIIFATARSYRDCLSILEGELKKLTVVLA